MCFIYSHVIGFERIRLLHLDVIIIIIRNNTISCTMLSVCRRQEDGRLIVSAEDGCLVVV